MIKEERINRKKAILRVKNNLSRLDNSNKTIKDIFDISFSRGNFTIFNVLNSYSFDEISYDEAREKIKSFAAYFQDKIPEDTKYVGIYLNNSAEWVYTFYGLLMGGYIPVLLSTSNDSLSNNYVLKTLKIEYIISDKKFDEYKTINPFEIKKSKKVKERWADEIVLITSGTTGNPKIVFYDGHQLSEQIKNAGNILLNNPLISSSYKGYLKQLAILPFYHIFGLVAVFIWFTFFNTTIVIPMNLSPIAIRQACLLTKVTHVFAVPLFWRTVTNEINKFCEQNDLSKKFNKGIELSIKIQKMCPKKGPSISRKIFKKYLGDILGDSIRFCINGGAFLDPNSFKTINGLGYVLVNGYGSTETGITSLCSSKTIEDRLSNSIGLPFDTVEYKISEQDGQNHLLVKGASLAHKIILPDGNVIENKDNYIDTLDIVTFDSVYHLSGRADEMTILNNGQNFSLPLLEQMFSLPLADDFVLIKRKENDGFNLLISYKKKIKNEDIAKEINTLIKENKFALIKNIFITYEKFPKSNELKVKRNVVEQRFYDSMSYFKYDESLKDKKIDESISKEVLDKVIGIFSKILCVEEIKPESDFYIDLGGDSLKHFALLSSLSEEFKVNLEYDPAIRTPGDFARMIEGL